MSCGVVLGMSFSIGVSGSPCMVPCLVVVTLSSQLKKSDNHFNSVVLLLEIHPMLNIA